MLWFLFGLLWISSPSQGSLGAGERLSREEVLSWFRLKVLDGLGVEEPPVVVQGPDEERRHLGRSVPGRRRTERVDHRSAPRQDTTQMILFPSSEPSCASSVPGHSSSTHFAYFFQPSINPHDSLVTSAQLWFYSGLGVPLNSSAPLSMLISGQQLLEASPAPSHRSRDGWSTYYLNQNALKSMGEGPFLLQVQCLECQCYSEPDKTPFLNLIVQSHGPKRRPRSVPIPWSPSVLDLLQRPSPERHGDCHRAHIEISFDELGWDNWIVHPKSLTFFYCHGNCSSPDRTMISLGMTQCCAPVPGSMRSLRITTTSDGGYSFKYETLPNIIPEECACI